MMWVSKKNEENLKKCDSMYRSVNPYQKGFPQTRVATMANTREALFSFVEK